MALRYLLDTDICIYIRVRKPSNVLARFEQLEAGDSGMSAITYGELSYGAMKAAETERGLSDLGRLAMLIPVLPMPQSAGETYGTIRVALERKGEIIGGNDLWIAAHALAGNLILVTNNEREFKRVPGLKVENWAR